MSGARICLLTGAVGAGKTTVAGRVLGLALRRGWTCRGLLAPALQSACGEKAGIWGVDVASGERRILARIGAELAGPRIGPYSFDVAALSWAVGVVTDALEVACCDLLVVDEIGKLELWQGQGLAPVLPRLAAGEARRALVVVRDSLLEELRDRLAPQEVVVWGVDEDNRDRIAAQVLESLLP